ncbi:hypothetical protein ACVXG7_02505 [Enterobacter hormaechei]
MTEPTLQTTRDPDIFAIGDCAPAHVRKADLSRLALRLRTRWQASCCITSWRRERQTDESLCLQRPRLSGVALKLLHRGQPDG